MVQPVPAESFSIATGGQAQLVFKSNPLGGFLQNPLSATESLFVNPIGAPTLDDASNTTFEIVPGGIWNVIPEQISTTQIIGATSGHKFSAVVWYV